MTHIREEYNTRGLKIATAVIEAAEGSDPSENLPEAVERLGTQVVVVLHAIHYFGLRDLKIFTQSTQKDVLASGIFGWIGSKKAEVIVRSICPKDRLIVAKMDGLSVEEFVVCPGLKKNEWTNILQDWSNIIQQEKDAHLS